MSTPTNHWKLGLFVLVALALGLGSILYLSTQSIPKQTVTYHSYFDEAVTGLEVGAPVRFRGVTVGNVSRIEVARDRRHVKVSYKITVSVLGRLGIATARGQQTRLPDAPSLRAQLNMTGVSGVKYVQLDFFDRAPPPPRLPFPVGDHYIPAQPSVLKNIESSVVQASDDLPEVTVELIALLTRINRIADQIERQKLPRRAASVLVHAEHSLSALDAQLAQLDLADLSLQTRSTLAAWNATATRASRLLDRVDAEQGLLADTERVATAMGDAARNANGLSLEAEHTLRDVGEAANAVERLANLIERQPDILLKGRASRSRP